MDIALEMVMHLFLKIQETQKELLGILQEKRSTVTFHLSH